MRLIAFTSLFLVSNICLGQGYLHYISADIFRGHMVKNYPTFPSSTDPLIMARVRLGKNLFGNEYWHHKYHYPKTGINIVAGSLGNHKTLGYMAGAMFDFSLSQKVSERFTIEEGVSLGLAYYTRHYNEQTNPENIAVGSRVTAFVSASFQAVYRINSKGDLLFGVSVLHGSNSHTAIPNLGVNMPGMHVGYRYNVLNPERINPGENIVRPDKRLKLNLRFALGINEQGNSVNAVNGPLYPIYIGSIYVTKKFSPISKVWLGAEAWYNTGVESYVAAHHASFDDGKTYAYASQLTIGHEFLFSHFSLYAQGGVYVYNPFYKREYKDFYNGSTKALIKTIITAKLGLQYYFKNVMVKNHGLLYIGTYVKTNFGQADFWENAVGYQF